MNREMQIMTQATIGASLLLFAMYDGGRPKPAVSPPVVPMPFPALAEKVAPVVAALESAPLIDRLVWAEVWSKSATVVQAEGATSEPVFTDAKGLRTYTVVALEVAWRRIRGVPPGKYPQLRKAVEDFLGDAAILGRDDAPLDDATRKQYAEACRALAWAGFGKG